MQLNQYAHEKAREVERELMEKRARFGTNTEARKPILAPLAARTGRVLQRLGGGLESWGNGLAAGDRRL